MPNLHHVHVQLAYHIFRRHLDELNNHSAAERNTSSLGSVAEVDGEDKFETLLRTICMPFAELAIPEQGNCNAPSASSAIHGLGNESGQVNSWPDFLNVQTICISVVVVLIVLISGMLLLYLHRHRDSQKAIVAISAWFALLVVGMTNHVLAKMAQEMMDDLFFFTTVCFTFYEIVPRLLQAHEANFGEKFQMEGFAERVSFSLNVLHPTKASHEERPAKVSRVNEPTIPVEIHKNVSTGVVTVSPLPPRILQMRSLLDIDLAQFYPSEYIVETIINEARDRADVDLPHPFLCITPSGNAEADKLTHARLRDQIVNLLSSRFGSAYMAEALGAEVAQSTFVFGLTHEKRGTASANRKYRLLICNEEHLRYAGERGDPDTDPSYPVPEIPKFATEGYNYAMQRIVNLKYMWKIYKGQLDESRFALVGKLQIACQI